MRAWIRTAAEAVAIAALAAVAGVVVNVARGGPHVGGMPPVAGACSATPQAAAPVPFIQPAAAARLHGEAGVVFVDARPPAEYATAHVAGAINLPDEPAPELPAVRAALAAARLIVYCDRPHCGLSTRTAQKLRDLGARDVQVLAEGWPSWLAHGYPAQSGGGS